ncbi:MAG: hypothetical protein KDE09_12010 [Anaerolineales bacterium]|nr:hypothetical protein [Anaerolineales bacterium]MCB8961837.1 hypothetical protein [Ardenticatenales bacterium]MCB0009186.1 hypothetical protein [Anaerolineales bacterium]MCB0011588.1 hypothetical protein [Anaerolineales bacterium]MCB0018506.1 hypothetical protein [Anaerolineales bacterium]
MSSLSYSKFLQTLPEIVLPALPAELRRRFQIRQPFRAIIQLYDHEPRIHYEVGRAWRQPGLELGFHFEARDKELNSRLLTGYRRHLLELKDNLGPQIEAERWDRGWTKIYEVLPEATYTTAFQKKVGQRLSQLIVALHPIYLEICGL